MLDLDILLVTRSEKEMSLFVEKLNRLHFPSHAQSVSDLTGDAVAVSIGSEYVKRANVEVRIIGFLNGFSTTALIRKIKDSGGRSS